MLKGVNAGKAKLAPGGDASGTSTPSGPESVSLKKPEVAECRAALSKAYKDRDSYGVLEAIKSVVAYASQGVDMSPLFPDVIKACSTPNIAQKKLVYMYLSEYSQRNSNLALLSINTLRNDSADPGSPLVRGLAMRAMGDLRIPDMLEYTLPPILEGLGDSHPYVRRTAAMAAAKFHAMLRGAGSAHQEAHADVMSQVVERVKRLAEDDSDAQVVLNAAMAMREMGCGGPVEAKQVVVRLLPRLRDLGEWGQCQLLEMVVEAAGEMSQEEVIAVMNLLDDRMQDSNSGVVLAVAKVFLRITRDSPDLNRQVYLRLKAPLLLLVDTLQCPELVHPVLCHLRLLLTRFPDLLESDAAHFFIRHSDPAYIRLVKVDLLTLVTTERNSSVVLDELAAYATDVDDACAKKSLEALGKIAMKLPGVARDVVARLKDLLDLGAEAVSAGVTLVLKDLVRKYPEVVPDVLPSVARAFGSVEDVEAKAAIIWMLGEFNRSVDDAPYVLESIADSWDSTGLPIKQQALISAVKMAVERPAEAVPVAGRILSAASADDSSADLRDRARLYYRLLQKGLEATRHVVLCNKERVAAFVEDDKFELLDRLFDEFNSLSVSVGKPFSERPHVQPPISTGLLITAEEDVQSTHDDEEPASETSQQEQEEGTQQSAAVLVDVDADGDAASGLPEPQQLVLTEEEPASPVAPPPPAVDLEESPKMTPGEFQKNWGSLGSGEKRTGKLSSDVTPEVWVAKMKASARHVVFMAGGVVGDTGKCYTYAQDRVTGEYLFSEVLVRKPSLEYTATFKGRPPAPVSAFADHFCSHFLGSPQ